MQNLYKTMDFLKFRTISERNTSQTFALLIYVSAFIYSLENFNRHPFAILKCWLTKMSITHICSQYFLFTICTFLIIFCTSIRFSSNVDETTGQIGWISLRATENRRRLKIFSAKLLVIDNNSLQKFPSTQTPLLNTQQSVRIPEILDAKAKNKY